jgi:hypothetical protein
MTPDADADSSQPPAMHLSSLHSVHHPKSNKSQSAHYMLSLNNNQQVSVTLKRHKPTAHGYLTLSSDSTNQRHCDGSASHNATTAMQYTCNQESDNNNNNNSNNKNNTANANTK